MFAAHHEKRFVPASFKVSIMSLEKRNYCFGKTSRKSLEVWIQKVCGNSGILSK